MPAFLSAPVLLVWVPAEGSGSSWPCFGYCIAPSHRLNLDICSSRLFPGLASDCLLSMEGRTLYLLKGASGARCSVCHIMGWDRERRDPVGRLGESGDAGGLWMLYVSAAGTEKFPAGLLRPLEDLGLVKCIDNQLLRRKIDVFFRCKESDSPRFRLLTVLEVVQLLQRTDFYVKLRFRTLKCRVCALLFCRVQPFNICSRKYLVSVSAVVITTWLP